MGVDVGTYGDHEVKAPEEERPLTEEQIIAPDINADNLDNIDKELKDLTDEELDAQLKTLSDIAKAEGIK